MKIIVIPAGQMHIARLSWKFREFLLGHWIYLNDIFLLMLVWVSCGLRWKTSDRCTPQLPRCNSSALRSLRPAALLGLDNHWKIIEWTWKFSLIHNTRLKLISQIMQIGTLVKIAYNYYNSSNINLNLFWLATIHETKRFKSRGGSRIFIKGGGARTHITRAKPKSLYWPGSRARLRALAALGVFDALSCYLSLILSILIYKMGKQSIKC